MSCSREDFKGYRQILVPLDGSIFAGQALPVALALARRSGASLQVLFVHTGFDLGEICLDSEDKMDWLLREKERNYLESLVKHLKAVADVPVTTTLGDGAVADAICEQAAASNADVIVMSTHCRGPLSRFWLGSIADQVVRRASAPVLLIRAREMSKELAWERDLQHVFIPLDGSAEAEQVLEPAVALGQVLKANFTLLRVLKPVLFAGHDPTLLSDPALGQPATRRLQAEACAYLESVSEWLRGQSLRVQTKVVVNTQPAAAILEESLDPPNGVIALTAHGHGGLTERAPGKHRRQSDPRRGHTRARLSLSAQGARAGCRTAWRR